MFYVRYRLTTNIDYIKSLTKEQFDSDSDFEGFFELVFNECSHGYHHNRPLRDGEEGGELLTNWFTSLLDASIALQSSSYVAISDIESYSIWIELKRDSANLVASIVRAEKGSGSSHIRTAPLAHYSYGDWNNISIAYEDFKTEVIVKAKQYVAEVSAINPKLLESRRLGALSDLISKAIP